MDYHGSGNIIKPRNHLGDQDVMETTATNQPKMKDISDIRALLL
jgi:hypothetical protein